MTADVRLPIAIVGGGISGLAIAAELRRRDPAASVVVLEAGDRPGGLLVSERRDGFLCEHAANGFLDTEGERTAPALARELGVDVVTASVAAKRRWVWRGGGLRDVPSSPPALIKTKLLSWRGKLRLLLEPVARRPRGSEETVAAFARRRLGAEAAEAVVAPFVGGIYAGDAERLSVQAALPRLAELEARHGGLVRGMIASRKKGRRAVPVLATPRAGVGALPDALARRLGDVVRVGVSVTSLAFEADRVVISTAAGEVVPARRVVFALPPAAAATLLEGHDTVLATRLREIETVGVTLAYVGFNRGDVPHPLDGFGFLVAGGETIRCIGCLFESSIWPDRAPDGKVLLRLIFGGARDPAAVDLEEGALRAAALRDLRIALGIEREPAFFHYWRQRRAIPQYNLGHQALVAEVERRADALGVVLAGNAFHGVAVNDCVKNAAAVVDRLEAR